MGAWKLDLVFEARGRGWEETYYADFGVADFGAMNPIASKLADLRIAMSAPPVEIKAYRVSDPFTSGRQGQVFYFKPRKAAPAWPGELGATDPTTSVNINFIRNANNATRQIWLRGCPDSILDDFGELAGPQYAVWSDKFLAWRQFLLGQAGGQGGGIRYGWATRPTVADKGKVTYIYAPGAVVPTFTLPTDFFPASPNVYQAYVRISGLNGSRSPLNTAMIINVLNRTTAEPVKPIAAGPMTTSGLMQRYGTPAFVTADNIGVSKAGRRAPGRPLLYTPGRRRGRARS